MAWDPGDWDLYLFYLFHFSFADRANEHTHLTFNFAHDAVQCVGHSDFNVCGQNNLPADGDYTDKIAIQKMHIAPQGHGAYAPNGWDSNKFTWAGTEYVISLKMADCEDGYGKYVIYQIQPNVNW